MNHKMELWKTGLGWYMYAVTLIYLLNSEFIREGLHIMESTGQVLCQR